MNTDRPLLVIDLDGPVLDVRARHHACYVQILTRYEARFLDISDYWSAKRAGTGIAQILAATGGLELMDVFNKEWLRSIEDPRLLDLDRLHDGADARLNQWSESGCSLILATMRQDEGQLLRQLTRLKLTPLFSSIVRVDHALGGTGKSDAVKEVEPAVVNDPCIWIGDTEVDHEAARSIGAWSWLLTCGLRDEPFLSALSPDRLSSSLIEVVPNHHP